MIYSKNNEKINFQTKFLPLQINLLKVSGQMDYKYGTIYREVLKVPKTNPCEVIDNIKESNNPLFKAIYDIAHDIVPDLVHPCPFTVKCKANMKQFSKIYCCFSFKMNNIRKFEIM